MSYVGRRFGLSNERGTGVFCDENGLLVGGVPLLERIRSNDSPEQWRPRPVFDLNRDLSKRYGLPIEISSKMGSLAAIARALDRGDLVHALIATTHLQFPDLGDILFGWTLVTPNELSMTSTKSSRLPRRRGLSMRGE
jgi:hypothetical protein